MAPRKRNTAALEAKPLKLSERLVLNQWMLKLLEAPSFESLTELLADPRLEGFTEDGVSRFHEELVGTTQLAPRTHLPDDLLLQYDENIVRYWRQVTERRNRGGVHLYPKSFQYLALLFTEIYLDRYFTDRAKLLADLNEVQEAFDKVKPERDKVGAFQEDELNKLAFWSATGSGKTLFMHVQLKQYLHYAARGRATRRPDRILLLTPDESLSAQHLRELQQSGIEAKLFDKDGASQLVTEGTVEILDIHKLEEESGVKTIAVEAFEGNNLVFVDEGHKGSGGDKWMAFRDRLCEKGFSFEYSATFGQSLKAAKKPELTRRYARCILFDYSYRYFYNDGYGKDFQILNLEQKDKRAWDEEHRELYLTGCLLKFYEQLRFYEDKQEDIRPYRIDRPLLVFVGGRVNAVRTENKIPTSDVVTILLFLAELINQPSEAKKRITRILKQKAGLLDEHDRDVFANQFEYLREQNVSPEDLYADLIQRLFHAPAKAAIHLDEVKGADGEIALRVGDNPDFGLINVGDAKKLLDLCGNHEKEHLVRGTPREFSGSLFQRLSEKGSTLHVLIGSKKFNTGWDSARVSTMGLMYVGQSEGAEIIQLFGRGVRLRGYELSLKRSSKLQGGPKPPEHLATVETLNVFGIEANYMREFREMLDEEGVHGKDDREILSLKVEKDRPKTKLKVVAVKDGVDFKRDKRTKLEVAPEGLRDQGVVLDWYPRLQARRSRGDGVADATKREEHWLQPAHLAFLDWDQLWFELLELKNERAWHNLAIERASLKPILEDTSWYRLLIPGSELVFDGFGKKRELFQDLAGTLLRRYVDRLYRFRKNEYESDKREVRELDVDDQRFVPSEYTFAIDRTETAVIAELKKYIDGGALKGFEHGNLRCFTFERHVFRPLVSLVGDSATITISPMQLNRSETWFVEDLAKHYEAERETFFANRELYLLRNFSRRGIGFFEDGGFYPDFILWLVEGQKQYVTFVDPHGLRHATGFSDPKIRFHHSIKRIEADLKDPSVVLESFVLSPTPYTAVSGWQGSATEEEFEAHHVLFQRPEGIPYVARLLARIIPSAPPSHGPPDRQLSFG